jgi:hypothetical protein
VLTIGTKAGTFSLAKSRGVVNILLSSNTVIVLPIRTIVVTSLRRTLFNSISNDLDAAIDLARRLRHKDIRKILIKGRKEIDYLWNYSKPDIYTSLILS